VLHRYNLPALTSLLPTSNFLDSLKEALQAAQDHLVKQHDCRLAALTLKRVVDAIVTHADALSSLHEAQWEQFTNGFMAGKMSWLMV